MRRYVGKIGIPDAILGKPGPLDEAERQLMRQHPAIGERILNADPVLQPLARLVRASHKRGTEPAIPIAWPRPPSRWRPASSPPATPWTR